MYKRIVSILVILLITSFCIGLTSVYASDVNNIIGLMNGVGTPDYGNGGISNSIKDVITLLQVAGTGIALVVITILGIKYMLASPSDKADVKKQIMPILIGCVLLFGALMIVSAITEISTVIESNTN